MTIDIGLRRRAGRRTALAAAAALLGCVTLAATTPAFAQAEGNAQREGAITVFMKSGNTMQAQVSDKATLDELTRGATPLDDHTMVVMHNGKFYLVKDRKTANGTMMSEVVMHMNQH